jgi:hypothetical protein
MNIDHGRTCKLEVNVMIVAFTAMARRDHGIWIEIDPSHERRFIRGAGIDKPALLMLAKTWLGPIPADLHPRSTTSE